MMWPADTRESQKEYCLVRAPHADLAISMCKQHRTAVQAGGLTGIWPMRMAQKFDRVITFEPEPITFACLEKNCADVPNIEVRREALGAQRGRCGMKRRSLSSHTVIEGDSCAVMPLDELGLWNVDLLQLDVEGYEFEALKGAQQTIEASHPIIQLELRNFTTKYGSSDEEVREWLSVLGYQEVAQVPGCDFIFCHAKQ